MQQPLNASRISGSVEKRKEGGKRKGKGQHKKDCMMERKKRRAQDGLTDDGNRF